MRCCRGVFNRNTESAQLHTESRLWLIHRISEHKLLLGFQRHPKSAIYHQHQHVLVPLWRPPCQRGWITLQICDSALHHTGEAFEALLFFTGKGKPRHTHTHTHKKEPTRKSSRLNLINKTVTPTVLVWVATKIIMLNIKHVFIIL